MQINKIIKMKDNKYKIIIDGDAIITYDNVILENDLLYKKNIDNDMFKKILNDTFYYEIYNKTIKYILKKRRSEKEIKKYLNSYELNNDKTNKIIQKLKELNLINDKAYCKAYINDKLYLSKSGINKIRIELLEQDISYELIESELKKVDTSILSNRLEKLIIKKINSNKKYSNNLLKQKILNEMINLGYDKNSIIEIIENNLNKDNDILNKEMEKIYNKLKTKYIGNELKNKLKQKLIQKGFSVGDINKLIQEKAED